MSRYNGEYPRGYGGLTIEEVYDSLHALRVSYKKKNRGDYKITPHPIPVGLYFANKNAFA